MWKYTFLIALGLIGCEDDLTWRPCTAPAMYEAIPLYSDPSCGPLRRNMIADAVDALNEMSNALICSDIVEYKGLSDDKVDQSLDEFDSQSVVCYLERPDWYDESRFDEHLGWSDSFRNIMFFHFERPLMSDRFFYVLMMHELFHYVGINGHSDDYSDVSSGNIDPSQAEYTRGDGDRFCEVYSCSK